MKTTSSNKRSSSSVTLPSRGSAGRAELSAAFIAQQFKPGQSGNPTGNRGARYGAVIALAREYGEAALLRLVQLMDSDDERIALLAAQAILDRALGRPSPLKVDESDFSERDPDCSKQRDTLRALLIKGLQKEAEERVKSSGRAGPVLSQTGQSTARLS